MSVVTIKQTNFRKIASAVVAAHLLLLAALFAWHGEALQRQLQPKRMRVHHQTKTISTFTVAVAERSSARPVAAKSVEMKEIKTPHAKNVTLPKKEKAAITPPKADSKKKSSDSKPKTDPLSEKKKQLLAAANTALKRASDSSALKKVSDTSVVSTAVTKLQPQEMPKLFCNSFSFDGDASAHNTTEEDYCALITQLMQSTLKPFTAGEVSVKLTVEASGTIIDLDVLKAGNDANRKYVAAMLPSLHLPPLPSALALQHTFTIDFVVR